MATPDVAAGAMTKTKTKEPGPGLWLSIFFLTVGTVAVSWGSYAAFQSAFELLSIDSFETPGSQTRDLDPGDYEIYVRSASVAILDLDIEFDDEIITLDKVRVVEADTGAAVPIERLSFVEPLSRSANIYDAVAVFEVPSSGRYTVTIDTEEPSRAVFGRSIETALDRVVPWLVLAAAGLLVFVAGLAMLIVGMVRRKRHRDAASASTPPMSPLQPPPVPTSATAPPPPTSAGTPPAPPGPGAPDEAHTPTPSTAPRPTRGRESEQETPW